MLYRVTITTPDGYCFDLSREMVYHRAKELGLEAPYVWGVGSYVAGVKHASLPTVLKMSNWNFSRPCYTLEVLIGTVEGRSKLDADTLLEGIVVWYQQVDGTWNCLKYKNPEFLCKESEQKDEGEGDVEDIL